MKAARYCPHEPPAEFDSGPPSPRSFGLVMSAALAVFAGMFAVLEFHEVAGILSAVALLFIGAALGCPKQLRTLNKLWHGLGLILHRLISPVVLLLVFIVGVVPTALLARCLRLLDFPLRPDSRLATYWSASSSRAPQLHRQY